MLEVAEFEEFLADSIDVVPRELREDELFAVCDI